MKKKIGTALVVGAGISGIRSALDLAEFGYRVTLVDRAPHLGGILSQLDWQFPTDGCGMCRMLPLVDRDASSQTCLRKGLFHENITILLGAKLIALEEGPGRYRAVFEQKPTAVDHDRCIGCGRCADVCPVTVPDGFNMGLGTRKAIYLPVPHTVPNTYVVDFTSCTRCGECLKVCPTQAIDFPEERRKGFHILVVDDELIVRDSLAEWLIDEGFSVDMAESGPAALVMLENKAYHLMLTDIKMPGMDGVELLKKAQGLYPDLTIVMMTAYATVETAVEAMKEGAIDYLLKPFDPATFTPKILSIYQSQDVVVTREVEAAAVVLSTGTAYFDPRNSKNTYGYGVYPDVVTAREFERLLSGTGPDYGCLLRRSDGREVTSVAWFQCVGSRDLQTGADFCSSVCCMHALKEARLVREKIGSHVETTIFYMDLRAFGKSFYQYQEEAEEAYGIRFERSRVHTVTQNPENGRLEIAWIDGRGSRQEMTVDMIVLSTGQRPADGMGELAAAAGLALNGWGFVSPRPFSTGRSDTEGIYLGGSFSGLNDIGESVIRSSSAALLASRFIHSSGGSLALQAGESPVYNDVSRQVPRILVMVCTCGQSLTDEAALREALTSDPAVDDVAFVDRVCTRQGWDGLASEALRITANRLLIGACLPYAFNRKIRDLAEKTGIHPSLIDVVDIRTLQDTLPSGSDSAASAGGTDLPAALAAVAGKLKTGYARLKRIDPPAAPLIPSVQRALVVGGGIAGMAAALAIADHGFDVDLVEQEAGLGGNLTWLRQTIDGDDVQAFLGETLDRIERHPQVQVHTRCAVAGSVGSAGHFITTLESRDEEGLATVTHGTVILATGGTAAPTNAYGYGSSPAVVTHKDLEQGLESKSINPGELSSVVMIQCVDSREASRKPYCSRICCVATLKHALHLKSLNPDLSITIFYRDLMAYGFFESYYTRARQQGILFIQYEVDRKPEVAISEAGATVTGYEPVIGRDLEISADLVVLATGVVPSLPHGLAACFGAQIDRFGFFAEADSKWRPVDALKEGVFACGLCHSPRSITEAVASAEAAAQRALRILGDSRIPASTVVARVRHPLCSLCERCIEACPYGARSLDPDARQVTVNPLMCQGCGACAAVCPNSASVVSGFRDEQVFDVIDSLL